MYHFTEPNCFWNSVFRGLFKIYASALAVPVMACSPRSLTIHIATPFLTHTLPHGTDHSGNLQTLYFFCALTSMFCSVLFKYGVHLVRGASGPVLDPQYQCLFAEWALEEEHFSGAGVKTKRTNCSVSSGSHHAAGQLAKKHKRWYFLYVGSQSSDTETSSCSLRMWARNCTNTMLWANRYN